MDDDTLAAIHAVLQDTQNTTTTHAPVIQNAASLSSPVSSTPMLHSIPATASKRKLDSPPQTPSKTTNPARNTPAAKRIKSSATTTAIISKPPPVKRTNMPARSGKSKTPAPIPEPETAASRGDASDAGDELIDADAKGTDDLKGKHWSTAENTTLLSALFDTDGVGFAFIANGKVSNKAFNKVCGAHYIAQSL